MTGPTQGVGATVARTLGGAGVHVVRCGSSVLEARRVVFDIHQAAGTVSHVPAGLDAEAVVASVMADVDLDVATAAAGGYDYPRGRRHHRGRPRRGVQGEDGAPPSCGRRVGTDGRNAGRGRCRAWRRAKSPVRLYRGRYGWVARDRGCPGLGSTTARKSCPDLPHMRIDFAGVVRMLGP